MMLIFFYFALFCFGAIFGSFSSVLISRWKTGERGILTGRSHCVSCGYFLTWKELIPIFSWLFQGGKCSSCHEKISKKYPIIEAVMGLSFMLGGYIYLQFFPFSFIDGIFVDFLGIPFISLLFLIFLTIVYILYDILYLEIPDEVFFLWILGGLLLLILSLFFGFENIYFNGKYAINFSDFLFDKFFAIIVLYSFLFLQIFIPGSLFLWNNKKTKEIGELFLLYFVFPLVVLYDVIKYKIFHLKRGKEDKETLDIPVWVGAGDLLLAIIIGGTLGLVHGIVAFFVAYLLGSIIGVIFMALGKVHPESQDGRKEIPFGPFLGIGFIFALTFYSPIISFIETYFLF